LAVTRAVFSMARRMDASLQPAPAWTSAESSSTTPPHALGEAIEVPRVRARGRARGRVRVRVRVRGRGRITVRVRGAVLHIREMYGRSTGDLEVPFISCRPCKVQLGTGAIAPPGAETLTLRAPG